MLHVAPDLDRPTQILAAAERCFARAGFHRATMQDVAREAGMSPGNLYRYFSSKAAIVAGLCERDQAELAANFAQLRGVEDFLGAFGAMAREHLVDEPRERAALIVEIWAEASRNPDIAAITQGFETSLRVGLTRVIEAGKARGEVPPDLDPGFAVRMMTMLADGLFKRRVLSMDFEPEREIGDTLAVFRALLTGAVRPLEA
jgi:AcrR family transcriptional regulator